MKKLLPLISVTLLAAVYPLAAATSYDGLDDNATGNDYIQEVGNWTNGLPGAGNDGTISVDAGFDSNTRIENYGNIFHSAGTVSRTNGLGGLLIGTGTNWVSSGSASYSGFRGLNVNGGGDYTQGAGVTGDFSNNNRDTNVSGADSNIIINGGSFTTGRSLRFSDSGTFTLNDGTVTYSTDGVFGGFGSGGENGTGNLNGGSLTAQRFAFQSGTQVNFGGSSAGTASFDNWATGNNNGNNGDRHDDVSIDIVFKAGSRVAMTMEGATTRALNFVDNENDVLQPNEETDAWAQVLWETGQLTYTDGLTVVSGLDPDTEGWTIVNWGDATNSTTGFGTASSEYFDWTADGFGGTLVLGTVVPEPSSFALLAGMFGLTWVMLRRRA